MIQAKYFDIIGFPAFIILLILGIYLIKKDEMISITIIIISILGSIVDGYSVITNFIIKH
jgi:hypothetical protein